MRWYELVFAMRYTDPRATARLVARMWAVAAERADEGTLGNMALNALDPHGVAMALDYAGIQPGPDDMPPSIVSQPPTYSNEMAPFGAIVPESKSPT